MSSTRKRGGSIYAACSSSARRRHRRRRPQRLCSNVCRIRIRARFTWRGSPRRSSRRCARSRGQPDFAHLVIDYAPARWLVESKSLKLYLGSFRITVLSTKTARSPSRTGSSISCGPAGCASVATGTRGAACDRRVLADGAPASRLVAAGPGRAAVSWPRLRVRFLPR